MSDIDDRQLNRNDLYLLLESYRNTIELNTTLIERQETIDRSQQKIIDDICEVLQNQVRISKKLSQLPDVQKEELSGLLGKINEMKIMTLTDHNSHKNQMYIAYVGMITIILTLLGMLAKIL